MKCQHVRTVAYVIRHLNVDDIEIDTRNVIMVELLYIYIYNIKYTHTALTEIIGQPGDMGSDEEY